MKKALLTGITGQMGSFLAELLLEKGYEVHGIIRRSSTFNTGRIEHIFNRLHLHYGDITDSQNIGNIVNEVQPDEIYNLAAQSHVKVSFEIPYYTGMVDALGTLNVLEAVRNFCPKARILQCSTSELYGKIQAPIQSETTPFYPRSPYGVAKLYGFWATKNYREAYNLFACNAIMFNNESEKRGLTFVTRKITSTLVRHYEGKNEEILKLGNLNAERDWGYTKEYAEGLWLMLQHKESEDFVLATGQKHTVRDFIEESMKCLGKEIYWTGEGINEEGYDKETGELIVQIDPNYFRPSDVETLLGDASKIKNLLGWEPKTKFKELVKIMIDADLKQMRERGRIDL